MDNSHPLPITVDPKGGEILSIVGDNYRVLVSGKQTNGAFATIDMLIPPQSGPGPHSHADFYEHFMLLTVRWKFILKQDPIPQQKARM